MEKDLVRLNYIRVLLIYCNAHDDITNSKFKESIGNGKSAKTSKMKSIFHWNEIHSMLEKYFGKMRF